MNNVIKYFLDYPLEIAISIAFASLFLRYPTLSIANLFILLSIIVSSYLFAAKNRWPKCLAIVILLSAAAIYYFLARLDLSYVFVCLSVIEAIALVYWSRLSALRAVPKNNVHRLFIAGLLILIFLPVTYSLTCSYLVTQEDKELLTNGRQFDDYNNKKFASIEQINQELSKDPFIVDFLKNKDYKNLNDYTQNLLVAKDFSYLIIATADGTIVVRGHNPSAVGDNIEAILKTSRNNLEDQTASYFYRDAGDLVVADAIDINSNGQKVGQILAGYWLNPEYLKAATANAEVNLAVVASDSNSVVSSDADNGRSIIVGLVLEQSDDSNQAQSYRLLDSVVRLTRGTVIKNVGSVTEIMVYKVIDVKRQSIIFNVLLYFVLFFVLNLWQRRYQPNTLAKDSRSPFDFDYKKRSKANIKKMFFAFAELSVLLITLAGAIYINSDVLYEGILSRSQTLVEQKHTTQLSTISSDLDQPYFGLGEQISYKILLDSVDDLRSASVMVSLNFSQDLLRGEAVISQNGICDKVYDDSVNNSTGAISFSCDIKSIYDQSLSRQQLAEITFRSSSAGVASIQIDPDYTYLLTAKNRGADISQSHADGDKIIVSD